MHYSGHLVDIVERHNGTSLGECRFILIPYRLFHTSIR